MTAEKTVRFVIGNVQEELQRVTRTSHHVRADSKTVGTMKGDIIRTFVPATKRRIGRATPGVSELSDFRPAPELEPGHDRENFRDIEPTDAAG